MRVKKAVWIGTDNTVRETDKRPTLKEMQSWVGGYIERTVVTYDGVKCNMYCNEDGHSMGLPLNARATALHAIANADLIHGTIMGEIFAPVAHAVVGNVVLIIGWRNW